ncbi:MAG: dynamin family protein [Aphanothece sp. CMT-3BRIN-NPC111]|jgi:GTPase SAR1 family protein|nr:dynamin family protein [Aphanothece sp. CMT-3BRIN-NPC111]
MDYQSLKPNVQDLQTDVIELLGQISSLMSRASTALSSDITGEKYAGFQQEVVEAVRNVENLKLMMAIVAPMKAGKSTIINAIVGQEILPSRNAAMTTLPTEIVFNAELKEPTLTLSAEILSVFQETLIALQRRNQALGTERMQEKIAQYPHLVDLLQEIQNTVGFPTHARTSGREEIIKTLTGLNDIIRLCSLLEPSKDPLGQLMDVPCIETPFWRSRSVSKGESQKTDQTELLGNLVIVDTPGPNEAGENLRLAAVVAEQLRKSSIVLIVLDFTQLNNKAAEEVKKQVQPVIKLLGKENLYVLVNKVDQRRKGDMTPEQVRQFVAADLGLGNSGDTDRVFEVSAIRAFSAAKFMLELQRCPDVDIAEMETAEALAQEALGAMWEEKLQDVSKEELQSTAEYIWKKSGFAPFLEKAIATLMESAAPRCMRSALTLSRHRLKELRDDVQLRSNAIAQDAEKLQREVGALETDLHRLELCRGRLKEVDTIKTQLHRNLNDILQTLQKAAKVNIEDYFIKEEKERANRLKKWDIKARELFLTNLGSLEFFPKVISRTIKSQLKFKTSGVFEFNSMVEAEEFANQAVAYAKQRADSLLSKVREQTEKKIEQARQELMIFLEKETQPIIERARTRLNEAFNINLSLPQPTLESDETEAVKPRVKSEYRYVDQGYGERVVKKRKFSHFFWMVPVEVKETYKHPDKREDYYTVSLEELISEINKSIETNIDSVARGITKYLDEDFQQRVDVFFEDMDGYLRNYRDSLRQAQSDQKLSLGEKEKLVGELTALVPEATAQIKEADAYIEYTDHLLIVDK